MSKKIKLTSFQPDENNFNNHTQYGMSLLEKSVERDDSPNSTSDIFTMVLKS